MNVVQIDVGAANYCDSRAFCHEELPYSEVEGRVYSALRTVSTAVISLVRIQSGFCYSFVP